MAPLPRIRAEGVRFVDDHGRTVILRGVNLGGDSKGPFPDGGTEAPTDFADHREVSFVGRPFPLGEADEHLSRLRRWGFNCVRLVTTWEAVEHAGPGRHDADYLDFLAEVCRRAGEHGIYILVDFHQDCWSRMTGGDGAPGWTLEAAGVDLDALDAADAALVMQHRYDYTDPRPHQPERYPRMCWSQNYQYPANAVMWTLFFGGRDFAPDLEVEGVNISDWLQAHFVGAQRAVAERVRDLPNVLGFGTLNEPSRGWIGAAMTARPSVDHPGLPRRPGLAWSPLLGLYAAAGHSVELEDFQISLWRRGCVPARTVAANRRGVSIWAAGREDPFRRAGAWALDHRGRPVALRDDHFQQTDRGEVSFDRDYLLPFFHRVSRSLLEVNPSWLLFVEKDPHDAMVDPSLPGGLPPNTVNAGHWYDYFVLLTKRYIASATYDVETGRPALGHRAVERAYRRQLARLRAAAEAPAARCPTLVGEFGIPFDLNGGHAYRDFREGRRDQRVWRHHVDALDLAYGAMDALLLSCTQWNYSATNANDPRIGDRWNQEDLSVFSRDQQDNADDPDSGGRALDGFVRPYARAIQGRALAMRFDRRRGRFTLSFEADPAIPAPSELFVPRRQFPDGFTVEAPGLEPQMDHAAQLLTLRTSRPGLYRVTIQRRR